MKKLLRILFYLSFIIYISVLIYILILSRRSFNSGPISYVEELIKHSNFIPFKTIIGYINDIVSNRMYTGPLYNLLGNLMICFPLGIYLTIFIKKSNLKSIFITSTFIIFVLEFIQLLLKRGQFDIDDLILNVIGAMIGYIILHNKTIIMIIKYLFGEDFYETN